MLATAAAKLAFTQFALAAAGLTTATARRALDADRLAAAQLALAAAGLALAAQLALTAAGLAA